MKDPEKTETENTFNHKLDTLKAVVEALAYTGHWMSKEGVDRVGDSLDRLKTAWKEKEDD